MRIKCLLIITVSLGLAACTSVGGAPEDPEGSDFKENWNPLAWEPTVEIEPYDLTDEEVMAQHLEVLSRNFPSQYEENPDVEIVAWQKSLREAEMLMADCLQEAGFPARYSPGGGIMYEPGVPEAQREALEDALYLCDAQYPLDTRYFHDWDDDQRGLVYDYWDEYFIPCMKAHGHDISRDSQPSRDRFIASVGSAEGIDWSPTSAFDALNIEVREALEDTCPPYPPDEFLYGL